MQYDVLSLGPARMDVFVGLPEDEVTEVCSIDKKRCMIELGFGDKIAVKSVDFAIGGNTGNNAVGLTRLGLNVAMAGTMGNGWTDKQAMEILKQEGVDTRYIKVEEGKQGFGVIINYQGERTILSYYPDSSCCFPNDPELSAGWIYLTTAGGEFAEFYRQAVEWAIARKAKIAFNPGSRQLKVGLAPLRYAYAATEVLFVNREEAQELLGISGKMEEIKEVLKQLREVGPKTVVVTDGPAGTYAYDGNSYYHMPIVEATVVERTGAGDAFGSGFLGAYISGKPIQEALRWGTVNSASVLGFIGPQKGLLAEEGIKEWLLASENITAQKI